MSGHDKAVEAATEAMSLPGEKGIVRALARDDAERATGAVIAEVVAAVRQHDGPFAYTDDYHLGWNKAADFIEREFGAA